MAMSLMGYKTEFIQMTCLTLLASQNFTEKRLAYLGICMLLNENSEILLLTSNIIKKDLSNNNQFIIACALNSIGEISTPDMCRDIYNEVLNCLNSSNPYIKKKACLALIKIIKSSPELLETVAEHLKCIFEDSNHGVLLSGLSLVNEIFKSEKKYIKKYHKYSLNLIKMFNKLISIDYYSEYDINGNCDPFLQVKILETLSYFAKVKKNDNSDLINLLSSVISNTNTSRKNTGNCILYELVRTIFSFESSSNLRNIASSILGKFLSNKDNNYKYLAMNSLIDIAKIDINSIYKHENIILEFLNDPDFAIKRKSLDLVFIIVNQNNIKQIINESLNFMSNSINDCFINELTTKIFYALEKYSPSFKYEIDILLKMLCLSEDYVSEDIIWKISNLILRIKELQQYSMFKFFLAMKNNLNEGEEALYKVGITILGELFTLIINVSAIDEEGNNILISENDIINLIIDFINLKTLSEITKEILMNTIFKILGKVSNENNEKLKHILSKETRSFYCEVQQRANEYITFTQIANDNMQIKITKNIPIPHLEFGFEKMNEIGREKKVKEKKIIVDEFEDNNERNAFKNLINGPSINNNDNDIPNSNLNTKDIIDNDDHDIPSSILSARDIMDINENISSRNKEYEGQYINKENKTNLLDDFNSIFFQSNNNQNQNLINQNDIINNINNNQNNTNNNINNNNNENNNINNNNNNQNDIINLIGNINFNDINQQNYNQNIQNNNIFPNINNNQDFNINLVNINPQHEIKKENEMKEISKNL